MQPPRLPLAAAVGSVVLLACAPPDAGQALPGQEGGVQARELPSVRVAPVTRREMLRVLETTSKLDSEREIEIVPRIGGVVLSLQAEEGDSVAQGDVLATLEDVEQSLEVKDAEVALQETENALDKLRLAVREAEASVERARITLEQSGRDYERNQRLFQSETKTSALSQSALEASKLALDIATADRADADLARERGELELAAGETAVERARITLERARLTLTYTRITTPFAGVVAQRNVKVGESVGPSTAAFVLTDVSTLRAIFSRPQEELALFAPLHAGGSANGDGRLTISATADAYPGRTFSGWVERVSPTIDAASGQFRVTARLECTQEGGRIRLLPGMLVRLSIITDRHPEALVLPKRALEREGERRYVLVADAAPEGEPSADDAGSGAMSPGSSSTGPASIVRRVEVLEGFSEAEFLEVTPRDGSRLEVGDRVIVVGGRDLAPGDRVVVDEERALPASAEAPAASEPGASR